MALTGQLSDLSLAELIEFFCNQCKTGRLKVMYERAPGYFFIQEGSLVDAKIGNLRGVDAVYYALTLANASFKFSTAFQATRRTIHQPWTHVALEGLRRLDEGIKPKDAFATDVSVVEDEQVEQELSEAKEEAEAVSSVVESFETEPSFSDLNDASPLSLTVSGATGSGRNRSLVFGVIAAAVLVIIAAISVPIVLRKGKANAAAAASVQTVAQPSTEANAGVESTQAEAEPAASENGSATDDSAAAAARHEREQRERQQKQAEDRARQQAAQGSATNQPAQQQAPAGVAQTQAAPKPGPRMVTVQVSYDENGRVTQASGSDATALRIARQKHFPAGKAGTATVTVPIN
ncbi:MAG: hypothetical protein AUG51_08850 [Acidobacteria bacterium 13_1_20CM_3_53_8]|nr:MAG: hypothetical protein AUG51_08850 [Acidobacteria bacterium 13_1_20CM_3_53_8]